MNENTDPLDLHNISDNSTYLKNTLNGENCLLPKSLLKDLIDDETTFDSQTDNIDDLSKFYPKNFDNSKDFLDNQNFSNYFNENKSQIRPSTYNNQQMNKSLNKIENNIFTNKNKKFSHNDVLTYSRPVINDNRSFLDDSNIQNYFYNQNFNQINRNIYSGNSTNKNNFNQQHLRFQNIPQANQNNPNYCSIIHGFDNTTFCKNVNDPNQINSNNICFCTNCFDENNYINEKNISNNPNSINNNFKYNEFFENNNNYSLNSNFSNTLMTQGCKLKFFLTFFN